MAVRSRSGRSELFLSCPAVSSSSFTCGLAGAIASNPVDVVRTRMMNQRAIVGSTELYKGTLDGLVKVRRRERGHILSSEPWGTATSSYFCSAGAACHRGFHTDREGPWVAFLRSPSAGAAPSPMGQTSVSAAV